MTSSEITDVLIIGGGIAGITTAIELLNHNTKVWIVDRDIEENFGGLAKESFGGMFFVDTPTQRKGGFEDSPELALKDWMSVAEFGEEDEWPKAWAKHYVYNCTSQVHDWLEPLGIKFFPVVHWVERGMEKRGNTYPRFHMVWGTGYELMKVLIKHLIDHPKSNENLKLNFGYKVEELLTDKNRISGAKGIIESSGEAFEIHAETTVVATGGIGGSIKKVKDNWYKPWGEPPKEILNGAHQFGDGILHDEVEKRNGKVTHLDWMWPYAAGVRHPRPQRPNHGLSLVPPKSALWLNYVGERIGPRPLITGYDTRFLVEQICKQKKKYSWQVLNLKIANKEFAISGCEFNTAIKDKSYIRFIASILFGNKKLVKDMLNNCEDFVVANSIEELAGKMNELTESDDVDVAKLKEAITNYDNEVDKGPDGTDDEQLKKITHARTYKGDKVRTCNFQKIFGKKAMPLIAIRESIIARKTLGGIQTDLDCKVLSNQGKPIDGLYAVGEVAGFGGGGMHGKGTLEGTFLGGCILTGRIAAYAIANKKLVN
ncbi:MAG: FAD-binding dehydrogenase [Cytophagales bacterium]|nr:FAD-binding dehydrogenase [Cytophagales bacterium]